MLDYIIKVVDALMITAVVIGFSYACVRASYGKWGKRAYLIGCLAGVALALIYCIITNTVRIKGEWKIILIQDTLYLVSSIAAIVMAIVFAIKPIRKKMSEKALFVIDIVTSSFFGASTAFALFYVGPYVLYYPVEIIKNAETFLSSDCLYALGGYLIGLLVIFIIIFGVSLVGDIIAKKKSKYVVLGFAVAALLTMFMYVLTKFLVIHTSRNFIESIQVFLFAIKLENGKMYMVFTAIALALIAAAYMIYLSFTVKEGYSNNAERRKLKARWILGRKWCVFILCASVVGILCYNWFEALTNTEDTVAEVEQVSESDDTYVYVNLEVVSDGHLHRFGYDIDGTTVKFIIIRKPNSTAYGIGLDACEICGVAGYVERQDKIVCKKCDVVMNINTIGMKGGCNPKILDGAEVTENGNIRIPIASLAGYVNDFK